MAKHKKAPPPEAGKITRRKKGQGRKGLDPDLEAFARSDEKRFRPRRPQRPRLKDPRPAFLIEGVSNRDARAVLDFRTKAIEEAEGAEFERLLAEVMWLALWRGRNFTAFDSYAEDVLGLVPAEAKEAAQRGAEAAGRDLTPLDAETIAIWIRTEAGALEVGGRVTLAAQGGALSLTVDVSNAPQVLHAIGRRMTPLVHDRAPKEDAPPPRKWEAEATKKPRRPK